jgi:hypothetical protein
VCHPQRPSPRTKNLLFRRQSQPQCLLFWPKRPVQSEPHRLASAFVIYAVQKSLDLVNLVVRQEHDAVLAVRRFEYQALR